MFFFIEWKFKPVPFLVWAWFYMHSVKSWILTGGKVKSDFAAAQKILYMQARYKIYIGKLNLISNIVDDDF